MHRFLIVLATMTAFSAVTYAQTDGRGAPSPRPASQQHEEKSWHYAELHHAEGEVFVNRGNGYRRATVGQELHLGDMVMVGADGGHAKISYDHFCLENVREARVVIVRRNVPCGAAGATTTLAIPSLAEFASAAAVAIGVGVGLGIYLENHGSSP